jgi:hypothetical protein
MPSLMTRRPDWMRAAFGLDPSYEVPRELTDLVIPTVDISRVAIRPVAFAGIANVPYDTITEIFPRVPGRSLIVELAMLSNPAGGLGHDFILEMTDGVAVIEVERVTLASPARAHLRDYIGDTRLLLAPPTFNFQINIPGVDANPALATVTALGWSYDEITD